ncbi:flavin reductase family protein [Oceanobacter antarcticus]|uniref:Flavin reductase family protein n=1 Tax=Oceanobacter antarcticus TaxID=3133425 RepID=A0ABW8NNY4_9GAMM|tara:strand:+ start:18458 stop:19000 length:543 start_codon:yes stop_codon:yes gene_type:complete
MATSTQQSECLAPPVDAEQFKAGMRGLAGAVSILSFTDGQQTAGLTATAVMSITATPPRLMVCVNQSTFAHTLVKEGNSVCINVLSSADQYQAQIFAGMVSDIAPEARFDQGGWIQPENMAPQLPSALVNLQCQIVEILPASSHSMVVCEVIQVCTHPDQREALVYFDGHFIDVSPANNK